MGFNKIQRGVKEIIRFNQDGTIIHRGELVSKEMLISAMIGCHEQLIKELDKLKSQEDNTSE